MSTNIVITIPTALFPHHTHLQKFFEGMIKKLDKNSHKATPTTADIPTILDLLVLEIDEFETQLREDKHNENTLVELMDVANFAFLAYVALRLQGVEHAKSEGHPNVG